MLLLEKFDCFGGEFRHNIFKQGPVFKSTIGGVISILTGIVLLIYIGYKMTLWAHNELTPNVISYTIINNSI